MTHQEIRDAFDNIYSAAREASRKEREFIDAERGRLQALCAGIGHVWGRLEWPLSLDGKGCVVCGARMRSEPPSEDSN